MSPDKDVKYNAMAMGPIDWLKWIKFEKETIDVIYHRRLDIGLHEKMRYRERQRERKRWYFGFGSKCRNIENIEVELTKERQWQREMTDWIDFDEMLMC